MSLSVACILNSEIFCPIETESQVVLKMLMTGNRFMVLQEVYPVMLQKLWTTTRKLPLYGKVEFSCKPLVNWPKSQNFWRRSYQRSKSRLPNNTFATGDSPAVSILVKLCACQRLESLRSKWESLTKNTLLQITLSRKKTTIQNSIAVSMKWFVKILLNFKCHIWA